MRFAKIKDGVVSNIVNASPEYAKAAGLVWVRNDAKIGMTQKEATAPEPESIPVEESIRLMSRKIKNIGSTDAVWDELDAAYTEGVNAAYDQ